MVRVNWKKGAARVAWKYTPIEALEPELWRALLVPFAQTMSRGRWQAYVWLRYVARIVEDALLDAKRTGIGARIIINAPPRQGKSETFSFWLPCWYLSLFPEDRVILTSYAASLAAHFGKRVRDELRGNELSNTRVKSDRDAGDDWETVEGGGMRTAGFDGGLTGRGADVILIDDPFKNWSEAMSPLRRQHVIDFFTSTLYTRAEPGASFIVVQTRWHERDLTGYLVDEHSDDWLHISLPAFAEEGDVLGREIGAPLCPERYDVDALERIRKAMPSIQWSGLYDQRPSTAGGNIIKGEWLRFYDKLPESVDYWTWSWDLTFEEDGSSFVVGQLWAKVGSDLYLARQQRDKLGFTDQVKAVELGATSMPGKILVEKKANGSALINTLSASVPGIIPVNPRDSKDMRLLACEPFFRAGNIHLPSGAEWLPGYLEELTKFPGTKNDDQVDATSQAITELLAPAEKRNELGVVFWS